MIKDLKPGRYRMKTYHHLTQDFGNTKFDIRVTDRDDSGHLEHENVGTSHGTNPSNLSTRSSHFLLISNPMISMCRSVQGETLPITWASMVLS